MQWYGRGQFVINHLDPIRRVKNFSACKARKFGKLLNSEVCSFAPLSAKILFNLTLKSEDFHEIWKLSGITPVHGKGAKIDFANYRPIAILNSF